MSRLIALRHARGHRPYLLDYAGFAAHFRVLKRKKWAHRPLRSCNQRLRTLNYSTRLQGRTQSNGLRLDRADEEVVIAGADHFHVHEVARPVCSRVAFGQVNRASMSGACVERRPRSTSSCSDAGPSGPAAVRTRCPNPPALASLDELLVRPHHRVAPGRLHLLGHVILEAEGGRPFLVGVGEDPRVIELVRVAMNSHNSATSASVSPENRR